MRPLAELFQGELYSPAGMGKIIITDMEDYNYLPKVFSFSILIDQ